jgi:hypothetical protein
MEIPKPPLNEINEQLIKDFLIEAFSEQENSEELVKENFHEIKDNPMGLYWEAFFIAYWIYNKREIKKVFNDVVTQELGETIEKNINQIRNRLDEDDKNEKLQKLLIELQYIQRCFKVGELTWPRYTEDFLREVAKQKIVNERGIYDSEDQGIRSYMRFRVAFERGIGAFDLEPNKNENEQIYVEGKRI